MRPARAFVPSCGASAEARATWAPRAAKSGLCATTSLWTTCRHICSASQSTRQCRQPPFLSVRRCGTSAEARTTTAPRAARMRRSAATTPSPNLAPTGSAGPVTRRPPLPPRWLAASARIAPSCGVSAAAWASTGTSAASKEPSARSTPSTSFPPIGSAVPWVKRPTHRLRRRIAPRCGVSAEAWASAARHAVRATASAPRSL
mmetsp:Transcript_30090/g.76033  ORF Transcript_30090/g.76033 Transcript_30090/m.76033 type:complete len:203 (+) Transcript_30090:371-979(+)